MIEDPERPEGPDVEEDELARLQGLEVSAVEDELGPEIEMPAAVLAEAVTALRAGKHLLLSGPPGTGKSTLATALCRAVLDDQFDVVTATADWTTFDTIGGYLPQENQTLRSRAGRDPALGRTGAPPAGRARPRKPALVLRTDSANVYGTSLPMSDMFIERRWS